jgi:hypothetical protein
MSGVRIWTTVYGFSQQDTMVDSKSFKRIAIPGELRQESCADTMLAGTYNPVWYGKDNNFALLPDGLYFVEITVNNESQIITVEINR